MSSNGHITMDPVQQTEPKNRRAPCHLRARVLLIMFLAVLMACGAALAGVTVTEAAPPPPADVFMEAIIKDDGALSWHQLCPSTQAKLPESTLIEQAEADRAARARQGITLSMDFIGARPRPSGGELRVYIVTVHWPDRTAELMTYSVLTQPSGCVEDVTSQ